MMKPLSERITDFTAPQFIDWLCLACVDVREVRTPDDAQEEINKIRDTVTERLASLEKRAEKAEAQLAELAEQEPVAYTDDEELRDVKQFGQGHLFPVAPVSVSASASACETYSVIELFTRAAPPAPFVVKLPKPTRVLSSGIDAYTVREVVEMLDRAGIKAAGGEVADE